MPWCLRSRRICSRNLRGMRSSSAMSPIMRDPPGSSALARATRALRAYLAFCEIIVASDASGQVRLRGAHSSTLILYRLGRLSIKGLRGQGRAGPRGNIGGSPTVGRRNKHSSQLQEDAMDPHYATGSGSAAAVGRHPIHPLLVPLPIGLLMGALVADIVFAMTQDTFWARGAFWLLVGGGITGV